MAGAAANVTYEDFEPYCKWQRDQTRDTFEVHLQGFKREQLRVQLSNHGIMTITGEQPLGQNKISRFRKDIRITKDYKTNEIHAKLAGGILSIALPKIASPSQDQLPQPPNQEKTKDTSSTAGLGSGARKLSRFGFGLRDIALIMGRRNVGLVVALVIVLIAFAMYKYGKPSQLEN